MQAVWPPAPSPFLIIHQRPRFRKMGTEPLISVRGMRLAEQRGVNWTVRLGWLRVGLLLIGR